VAAAFTAAVIVFVTGPDAPRRTSAFSPSTPTVRGAFHIHTTRSDGALDKTAIARQARRAGLQFAIFTDHGDATRTPDAPEYIDGVLCVDAVEISTNAGHYIALGLPAAPYRLGGDADAVAEDVARLGGFGVAAHPTSLRAELAWSEWNVPIDALEWLNADSEWRDEGRFRLTRTLIDYFWRPAGALASLLDRPVSALARWDQLAADRRVFALAGHDAHGGVGNETSGAPGRRLHLPSYEAAFRTFSVNVVPSRPFTGNPRDDARELLSTIRQGHIFTVVDAVASPGIVELTASAGGATVVSGEVLPVELGRARFSVKGRFPPGATIVLLRNGRAIAETAGSALDHEASAAGAYRAEVRVDGAPGTPPVPWLVSNPIFRYAAKPERSAAARLSTPVSAVSESSWHAEMGEGSSGKVSLNADAVTLDYGLKPGEEASQFVALAGDLQLPPRDATIVSFAGQADGPMRLSVQLRFAQDGGIRWRKSVYLDTESKELVVPVEQLRPADRETTRPAIERATSVLFVVDLTNASPGSQGRFTVRDVKLGR
jgi:hypothetical protein